MKTLTSLCVISLASALAVAPVSLELSATIAVLAGIAAMMLSDYGREQSAVALRG